MQTFNLKFAKLKKPIELHSNTLTEHTTKWHELVATDNTDACIYHKVHTVHLHSADLLAVSSS